MKMLTQALKNKLGTASNYLQGKRVLDNKSDPTSAYSMSLRKKANTSDPSGKPFKFADKQKTYGVPNAK